MHDDATRPIDTGRMQAKSARGEPDDQLATGTRIGPFVVDGEPRPKIIDFGIAVAAARSFSASTIAHIGTPAYMSPEQSGETGFGAEHRQTLTDANNLGSTLSSLGEIDEALPLYAEVVATRERTLGPGHPDTLSARQPGDDRAPRRRRGPRGTPFAIDRGHHDGSDAGGAFAATWSTRCWPATPRRCRRRSSGPARSCRTISPRWMTGNPPGQ